MSEVKKEKQMNNMILWMLFFVAAASFCIHTVVIEAKLKSDIKSLQKSVDNFQETQAESTMRLALLERQVGMEFMLEPDVIYFGNRPVQDGAYYTVDGDMPRIREKVDMLYEHLGLKFQARKTNKTTITTPAKIVKEK